MEKFQKYGFIFMTILIFVLYLVSSTELIYSDDTDHEIYNISVIIDDTTDSTWQNYKKGMEQAAMDYNVDVSFITLYSERNASEQLEFIKREAEADAQAIILAAVDSIEIADGLKTFNTLPHLLIIGTQLESEKVKASILSRGVELGEKLGNLIVEDLKKEKTRVPIYIFPGNTKQTSITEKLQGLVQILETNEWEFYIEDVKPEEMKEAMIEASNKTPQCVFIGLDTNLLSAMAEYQLGTKDDKYQRVYGVGYTNYILSSLEKEQLSGIIVENDYLKGYLSIEAAVSLINHNQVEPEVILDTYIITPGTVHDQEYEILLYPIS
jgi:ribose transport system substrate-binding protein